MEQMPDVLNNVLASFSELTSDWDLDYLARQQAKRQEEQTATLQTPEQTSMIDPAKVGWEEILPGVYRRGNEYTNVLDASGTPSMNAIAGVGGAKSTNGSIAADGSGGASSTFQSLAQQVQEASDPKTKATMLIQLQEAAAIEAAQIRKEAHDLAISRVGLPNLEMTLAQNEQIDRADPLWPKYQSDSPITAKIRKQVDEQRIRAASLADTFIASNPKLNAMDAKLKALGSLTALEYKEYERDQNAADASARRREDRQFAQQLRLDEVKAGIPQHVYNRMRASDPGLMQATEDQLANNYAKAPMERKKMWQASPDDLLFMATVENDAEAERMYLADAASANRSPAAVNEYLSGLKSYLYDDKKLINLYRRMPGIDDASLAAFSAQMAQSKAGVMDKAAKEAKEAFDRQKFNLAQTAVRREATVQFANSMDTWPISDPAILAAVDQAKQTTNSTDFKTVAAAYLGNSTGRERAAKAEELRSVLYSSAQARNNGAIVKLDPGVLWHEFLISNTRWTLRNKIEQLQQGISDSTIGGVLTSAAVPSPALPAQGALAGAEFLFSTPTQQDLLRGNQ